MSDKLHFLPNMHAEDRLWMQIVKQNTYLLGHFRDGPPGNHFHWYGKQKLRVKSIKPTQKNAKYNNILRTYTSTNVILTNERRIHAQSDYTNTKLKAWFRHLLFSARKRSGPTLHPQTHTGALWTCLIKTAHLFHTQTHSSV